MDSKETGRNMDPKNSGEKAKDQGFNAGGNDSDYDGGHPKDTSADSPGHIDSNPDKPGNT